MQYIKRWAVPAIAVAAISAGSFAQETAIPASSPLPSAFQVVRGLMGRRAALPAQTRPTTINFSFGLLDYPGALATTTPASQSSSADYKTATARLSHSSSDE